MKKLQNMCPMIVLTLTAVVSSFYAVPARAALIPTFVLAAMNNNTQVQVTVLNADPNAAVTLYYPVLSSYSSLNVGTTNGSGYFTTTITPSTYNVTIGGAAYVIIDGAQSQTQIWPSYTNPATTNTSGTLSLSQNNVTVTAGQTVTITAYSGAGSLGALSVPSNTSPSVASASVSGSQILVSGYNTGSTNMTVCASSVGCSTMYVTVQPAGTAATPAQTQSSSVVSFSQTSVTLSVGQSQTVSLQGPGGYYISNNSNSAVASAYLNNSVLNLNGLVSGSTIVGICSAAGTVTSCGSINVTVSGTAPVVTTNTNGTIGTISFSSNNVSLNIGQTQAISVTGSSTGLFYVSANSDPAAVTANYTSGNVINLIGTAPGGANITICQISGACGNVYAYVSQGSGATVPAATANTQSPVLSSFSVSSNDVNNTFLGTGDALTVAFSTSQPVVHPTVTIGGSSPAVYGSGSGPYTAIYTMTGNESLPIPIVITLPGAVGSNSQISFSVGKASQGVSATQTTIAPSTSVGTAAFTRYLTSGSTGSEVTALQTRLTALGFYSGPITGKFGGLTEAAVKAYQAKHKISQLGAVGPATRALLNAGE